MKKSYFLEGLTKRGIREGGGGGKKDCERVDQGVAAWRRVEGRGEAEQE